MKLQQMIELVRKHHPDLGSNEIVHLLNQASDEFCSRTLLLDEATQFSTVADQRYYGLKESILEIKSVDIVDDDGNTLSINRLMGRPEYRGLNIMAKVSWMWGGTRHYGTFIRETKLHIFARTVNGKIKKIIKKKEKIMAKTAAWQRKEGKNPSGGLNAKGRASYNKETGGNLQAPQPEGGSRKNSFCARMRGMKKKTYWS